MLGMNPLKRCGSQPFLADQGGLLCFLGGGGGSFHILTQPFYWEEGSGTMSSKALPHLVVVSGNCNHHVHESAKSSLRFRIQVLLPISDSQNRVHVTPERLGVTITVVLLQFLLLRLQKSYLCLAVASELLYPLHSHDRESWKQHYTCFIGEAMKTWEPHELSELPLLVRSRLRDGFKVTLGHGVSISVDLDNQSS